MSIPKILFVDDEPNILNSLRRIFRKEKYNTFIATSGTDGLKIINKEEISLVVSDQKMPGMSGVEFLNEVKKVSPQTMRIMLTGYADKTATMEAINRGEVYRFITKPWDDMEIKIIVSQALKQYELIESNKELNKLTRSQNNELLDLNANLEKKVKERTRIISQKKEELSGVYDELERNFFDSVRVFVGMMELYNPILGNHSKRTAVLARMMAENVGFSEKDMEAVEIAAMLHDIGMIGMPKEISNANPFDMRDTDRKIYEQHPITGQSTIRHIKKLEPIGRIIRSHHERFDGTGYPDGLQGENIPLNARIIAVADFYDEINIFGFPDLEAADTNAIIKLIKINSGKRFDPHMVECLIHVLKSIKVKRKNEKQVAVEDLVEGMVLSRDTTTVSGILLVTKGTMLDEIHINKINNYKKVDNMVNTVYIYSS